MKTLTKETRVHRLPMSGPNDTAALAEKITEGFIVPAGIVAILGKTEGNGCVNDFTRGYAVQSLKTSLSQYLSQQALSNICFIMSGGTEGALTPHWIVIETVNIEATPSAEKALAVGHSITRDFLPNEIGTNVQLDIVAEGVRAAMAEADINDTNDVHFVQIKCPLITSERVRKAGGASEVATTDTLKSMGLSRGASALGVASALGEISDHFLSNAKIGTDTDLFSSRASCSAGVELMGCEIVVLGMSEMWSGPLAIEHTVMMDAIDMSSVLRLTDRALGHSQGQLREDQSQRVKAVLTKAEAAKSGFVRGQRHTMLNDSDVSSTRHARGFVGGLLGGIFGDTALFVSGGAEHQGPDGGGPCALIYEKE
ncbi:MAG: ring-opening amidohydrolase [Hyphomicrobiales bacterium]